MLLFFTFGRLALKVDQPQRPSGQVGKELQSIIFELAAASGGKVELTRCRMIAKQYIVVICEINGINRSAAIKKLLTEGWRAREEQAEDELMLEFSRGGDHLTIESMPGGSTQAISVIRRFSALESKAKS